MTDIALDREQTQTAPSSSVLKIISILLMVIGLIGAVSLLNWAVSTKLSRSEVTETTQVTLELRERQLACLSKNIYLCYSSFAFKRLTTCFVVNVFRKTR